MIRSPEVRAAAETMRLHRKALRQKRTKPAPEVRGQRDNRQRDPAFLAYLRRQPCEARHMGGCDGPIEAAHIRYSDASKGSINPGMQRKNHDKFCNPLCRHHHQHDQHKGAERFFWERIGKDAYETAAKHHECYEKSV